MAGRGAFQTEALRGGPDAGARPVWGGGQQEDMRSERELGHSVGGPISILRTSVLLEWSGDSGQRGTSGVENALRPGWQGAQLQSW